MEPDGPEDRAIDQADYYASVLESLDLAELEADDDRDLWEEE